MFLAVATLATVALLAVSYTYDSCAVQNDDESNDPGISDPDCRDTACASAVKRCKGRYNPLENIHNAWATIHNGPTGQPEPPF